MKQKHKGRAGKVKIKERKLTRMELSTLQKDGKRKKKTSKEK